jgi:geranylgeranyl pyrophosphate synthase
MQSEVMAGQYLDVLEQARGGASVERALRVARYKTAKYTIERPLQLGAELAGADERITAAYSAYGVPLGEAFQLRDDVLGVFGDPAETASRRATTCARASAPCCSRWPRSAPTRGRRPVLEPVSATRRSMPPASTRSGR